jgi:signal transduction histidine kinase
LAAYLAAHGQDDGIARAFAAGIGDVIRGDRDQFTLEYPSHAPSQRGWFRATITRSAGAEPLRLVVLHEDITQRKNQEANLRRLSSQLLKLQEEERRHIARELHDSTAQKLAAIIVGLSLLEDDLASGDVPKAKRLVAEFLATAEDCARDVRELSHLLHPPLLDELGLEAALDTYVHGLAQRSGLQVTLDVDSHLGSLPKDLALALYRITQECLSNVLQHSGSKTASVQIARAGDKLILEVRDRGRGIPETTLAMLRERQAGLGFGILGMQERLEEFEGTLEIDASALGTSVRAFVPRAQERHEENSHPPGR